MSHVVMDRSDAKLTIIISLAGGLCRAEDLALRVGRSVRTVYRLIGDLKKDGHRIRGEAGVGFVIDTRRPHG